MLLYVVSDYQCRDVHYEKGQVLEVASEHAIFLLADAPGCFALKVPEKAPEKPPADKMQRRVRTK